MITNYDFKANEKEFIKVCNTKRIKKLFKKCIMTYLIDTKQQHILYNESKPPLMYGSYYIDDYRELQQKYIRVDDDDDYKTYTTNINNFIYTELLKSYKGYVIYGACHWLNKIVMLEVARILEPNEEWTIRTNNTIHTTIINKNQNKVFDIIMYDDDYYDLGGLKAYSQSDYKAKRKPKKRRMFYCEVCKEDYKETYMKKHIQTNKHKYNNILYGVICE